MKGKQFRIVHEGPGVWRIDRRMLGFWAEWCTRKTRERARAYVRGKRGRK